MPDAPEPAARARDTGRRAFAVAARAAHITAMAILAGGAHFSAPHSSLRPWIALTVASGVALLLVEASHSRHWAYQVRGVLALGHTAVAALVPLASGAMIAALVVGALGSHLPRAVRWWSLRHRRVV